MKISAHLATLALICGIVSGCSSINSDVKITASPDIKATHQAESTTAESTTDLPKVKLTDEILFKVISAEIALQRGDFAAAFATTLSVAQQTRDPRLAKRAMEMALINKQPQRAFVAARLWREYAPHSNEATQYYLGFMIINNNSTEVVSVISARLAAATPKERGLIILETQRLLARSDDKDAAFKIMEQLCKPYPDYLESHLALAQTAFASNNSARALAEARQALKINPASPIAALTLAQVSPTPTAALQSLTDFLARNPSSHDVRRAYAGMLIEQKRYTEARSQFELLAKEKPEDPTNFYALGVLSLELNEAIKAEKYLKDFVQMPQTTTEQRDLTSAYLYLSQIADDRNEGVEALNWLNKIQSFEGKNAAYLNAQLRRVVLMAKYGSVEDARQLLHEIKASPNEQIQLIQMDAELLRNSNRQLEALALLQEAIKTHPNNPDLLYDFAMLAEQHGRHEEMEKALKKVIKVNPEHQQAYNALGYSLADRNVRLAEARALIEKALTLAPNDAFILDSMGWLSYRERKDEAALTYLQRAYQIRPDADIAVHLGEVLWGMGEKQKAKAIWKEAKQKDPKNTALKMTLARLKVDL